MLKHRVIPVLLLKNGGLVKTRKFRNPKYVGDPVNAIRIFNEKEVDELIVLDIDASKYGREPDYKLIEEFASECFMPLAYGGGVHTVEQAAKVFSLGVEKVCVQTAALKDINIISELASKFGSQSIVISIDVKPNIFGNLKLYNSTSKRCLSEPWHGFIMRAQEAGVGEILVNAVHKDGVLGGPDIDMVRQAASMVTVPLIAVGGVSSLQNIKELVLAGASAVAAGAFFVFHGPHRAVLITYPDYKELEKLFTMDK